MSLWIKIAIIGLIIAVIGAVVGVFIQTNAPSYSSIAWGVCAFGIALIILGIATKIKHLLKP